MPFFYLLISILFAAEVDTQWLRLLHYEKSILGNTFSRAEGKDFFLSKTRTPKDELESFIQAVNIPQSNYKNKNAHPLCLFPLRAKYILRKGYVKKLPRLDCDVYKAYKKELSAEKISLVFSSYFIESASSAFGHTFLRIHQPKKTGKVDLLDFGIGYAGKMDGADPISYMIKGFTGGFPGLFTKVPFYYKVREYNDFETRDLWSYELKLTPQEIDDLVDHLWEVSHTYFPYYYLSENCAYYLLEVIEIVAPRYKMLERLPFWIIPIDTVKAAFESGIIGEIHYRPSAYKKFVTAYQLLNKKEKKLFQTAIDTMKWEGLNSKVLDLLIDYIDVRHYKEVQNKKSLWAKAKYDLSILRSQSNEKRIPIDVLPSKSETPHLIFPLQRLRFFLGHSDRSNGYFGIEQRFANHDILDPVAGKPPNSSIEFFKLSILANKERVLLKDFALVSTESYPEWTSLFPKYAWGLKVGAHQYSEICDSCISPSLEFGAGFAWNLFSPKVHFSSLLWIESFTNQHIEKSYSARLGPKFQLMLYLTDDLRILSIYQPSWELRDFSIDYEKTSLDIRYDLFQWQSLNLSLEKNKIEERVQLDYLYYY